MEKKILVAIDDSRQAVDTVGYAAQIAAVISPVTFSLLHVQPSLSQYLTDEAQHKHSAQKALEKVMAENEKKGENPVG